MTWSRSARPRLPLREAGEWSLACLFAFLIALNEVYVHKICSDPSLVLSRDDALDGLKQVAHEIVAVWQVVVVGWWTRREASAGRVEGAELSHVEAAILTSPQSLLLIFGHARQDVSHSQPLSRHLPFYLHNPPLVQRPCTSRPLSVVAIAV